MDQRALNKCHVILANSLDVQTILPHMIARLLLTSNEIDTLINPYVTNFHKVNYLVQILPRKGNGWLDTFIDCLESTSEGTGHSKIAQELKNAKHENHEERQRGIKHIAT